jgi:four helix bundle protein
MRGGLGWSGSVKREASFVKRMNGKIRNFRDLDIWKLGKKLVIDVYQATQSLPKDESYGLMPQMRRATVSIPSNIAEGFNRFHNNEYRQFLYIALGSCAELETQIEIAFELKYLQETAKNELLEILDHETRMLRNLIKKL